MSRLLLAAPLLKEEGTAIRPHHPLKPRQAAEATPRPGGRCTGRARSSVPVLGFSPLRAGLAFLPMTLGIFAMSRITPRLLARFGRTPLLLGGTLGLTASCLWLGNVAASSGHASAVLGPLLLNGLPLCPCAHPRRRRSRAAAPRLGSVVRGPFPPAAAVGPPCREQRATGTGGTQGRPSPSRAFGPCA